LVLDLKLKPRRLARVGVLHKLGTRISAPNALSGLANDGGSMAKRQSVILSIAVVVLLPVIVLAVFLAQFNPNAYKPAMRAAIERATGRVVTLGGPIHLHLSLTPSVELSDVSLGNRSGFADAALLTVDKIQLRFLLLPLLSHHVDITDLTLVHPQVVLERDAAGDADWDLAAPATRPASAPSGSSGVSGGRYDIAIRQVRVQGGVVTIRSRHSGEVAMIEITELLGTAATLSSPLSLSAHALYKGLPVSLSGIVGPVTRFSGVGSGPWPVDLALTTTGAAATVHGGIAMPRAGRGYNLAVSVTIPALEAVALLVPAGILGPTGLPPVHDIVATAKIVDQGSTIPAIDDLSIKTGASDLSAFRTGLLLQSADVEMPSLDKSVSLAASGTMDGQSLALSGKVGAVQAFLPPALLPASMPPQVNAAVMIQASDGPARMSAAGEIAAPESLAGVAITLNASIPDLGKLADLAGTALPDWRHIVMRTTLIDPGGVGLASALGLDSFAVTMDGAAFGGDASLDIWPRPRFQAAMAFRQLNLDQILGALPAAAPPVPAPATVAPAGPSAMVIPAYNFPLALLKSADADVQVSADTLIYRQTMYTGIAAHATVAHGLLTLNPVTGELPGGSVSATGTLDATKEPAAATLSVIAPALALSPVLQMAGLPDTAQGTVQVRVQFAGTGDSLRDIAATLNGQMGVTLVNGIIDGSVIERLVGSALAAVGLPSGLVNAGGPVPVRCFGLRVDAAHGVGTVRTLTLDSRRLLLQGGGSVAFGPETLNLVLHPELRLAGTPESVPVAVTGSFEDPRESVDPSDAVNAAADAASGLAKSLVSSLGGVGWVAGKTPAGPDVCPAALSLGRLGQPGPAAPPPENTALMPDAAPALSGPKSLLNALFGK
jgi:AsmA protein